MEYKKIINEINSNYKKVKSKSFGQNEWSSQGRKITINIETFEKLDNKLNKGITSLKENSLDKNNKKTIKQIETLLAKAKKKKLFLKFKQLKKKQKILNHILK